MKQRDIRTYLHDIRSAGELISLFVSGRNSALVGEAEARSIVRDTEEALSWVRSMLN
jgi:hypothetical protein